MITIFELLSKIKWDEKEDPSEYTVAYYDRLKDNNIEIPLHRVRKVYKKGMLLWSRES